MKRMQLFFVVGLLCVTTPVFAQKTSKTSCMSAVTYTSSEEDLKDDLLTAAKQEVVQELFGEEIAALTTIDNFALTEEEIHANALTLVQIEGEPTYVNGQLFGEVCVTIDAYVTEEDREKFKPHTLTKKTCKEGDEKTIKQETEEKAILRALTDYDQQVEEHPSEKVLPLLHDVTVLEGGFEPETEFYCAKVRGVIYPIELMGVLAVVPTPAPEEVRDKFSIDFRQYELGDIPAELGRDIVIGLTKGDKFIRGQVVDPAGEITIKDLVLSDSLELTIKVYLADRQRDYPAFYINIQPDNAKAINVLWIWPDYSPIGILGTAGFGTVKRELGRTAWKQEVNTIKVIVKEGQAKIFINNQLVGSTLVKAAVNYSSVQVGGLIDHDAVFGLSGRKLESQ